jgi:predicted regulator of Ras-like GTPase activity (Roadblock/LC7/MglB family)
MFEALLKDVVESLEGGVAAVVMDLDGITLASHARASVTDDLKSDIRSVGIELTVVLRSVKQAMAMLEVGEAEEVVLVADQLTTVVRIVTEHYFVAVALAPGGNLGRARYLLRVRVPELVSELS